MLDNDFNKYFYINMGNEDGNMLSVYESYVELLNSSEWKGFIFDIELDIFESYNIIVFVGMSLVF